MFPTCYLLSAWPLLTLEKDVESASRHTVTCLAGRRILRERTVPVFLEECELSGGNSQEPVPAGHVERPSDRVSFGLGLKRVGVPCETLWVYSGAQWHSRLCQQVMGPGDNRRIYCEGTGRVCFSSQYELKG